jgi:hypothetical protein
VPAPVAFTLRVPALRSVLRLIRLRLFEDVGTAAAEVVQVGDGVCVEFFVPVEGAEGVAVGPSCGDSRCWPNGRPVLFQQPSSQQLCGEFGPGVSRSGSCSIHPPPMELVCL